MKDKGKTNSVAVAVRPDEPWRATLGLVLRNLGGAYRLGRSERLLGVYCDRAQYLRTLRSVLRLLQSGTTNHLRLVMRVRLG